MNNLFVIGIFLAFFLQFLLFTKKNKTLSDKILCIWMFVIGIHLFSYYLYELGFWDRYPHLVGATLPVPLLHGPLLYLYVAFAFRKEQQFRLTDYAHFLPALLCYLYMFPFFFFYTAEQKIMLHHGQLDAYSTFSIVALVAFVVSGITYSILSFRLIGKVEKLIHANFSFDEKISLGWLRYCILGVALIFCTVAFFSTLQSLFDYPFTFNVDLVLYAEIILFIFLLGFFGIRQEGIFSSITINDEEQIADTKANPNGEYKKSGLKVESAEQHHQKLLELMQADKLYLESKLSLSVLAVRLDVSVNHLSQIINQYEGKNFYDFINEYRVEEFKERAVATCNQHLSILAIALDSGFSSKSSFNLVFKKHTGITPSQYLAEKKSTLR
ncbi:helix-turn-helix domain-containing protein [uncultured Acetobacteroides sp.]|uniref:helix-turn-helix domain-containing protein n=1 Tax=uncultured Acetobacteroides sp. TaxID=1760811 RepID=UPI0029F54E55|nr:helix-turn-helix domain-containing protein [uncultured Acetobacteroides sp.]